MRTILFIAALAAAATPAMAQEEELTRPPDWIVRFDRPAADSAIYFVDMPPGWHITTGPAAILYHPGQVAKGSYRLASEIYLFPGERLEGFGVFFGGSDLEGDAQAYTYFLIRKDGQFLVKDRRGEETTTLIPWTASSAIVAHDGGEGTAKNVIEVHVGPASVGFFVNGQEVGRLERNGLQADGVVGLRVNHRLNVHVTQLTIEQRD
ncbi:MAG: hypothetical protein IH616_21340 [Gemmatimonadales bacterium]|nr:hypothetical protein [Gemmatimonadales bacterium]